MIQIPFNDQILAIETVMADANENTRRALRAAILTIERVQGLREEFKKLPPNEIVEGIEQEMAERLLTLVCLPMRGRTGN